MAKKKEQTENGTMTLSGHLKELRNRIIICVISLVVFMLIGLYFSPRVINFLTALGAKLGYEFIYISPAELLLQQFSVAFKFGLVVTIPLILYHVWAFIQPGLKKNENHLFLGAIVFGLICFVIGVFFAYKVMLPFTLRFLIGLSIGTDVTAQVTVGNYISFLLTIFLIFGIIFELPVITVLLTQMGLLKVEWMKKARKLVIVAAFLVAAFITPPDVVSQIMVAVPMLGLYELSIVLCTILLKFKRTPKETDAQEKA